MTRWWPFAVTAAIALLDRGSKHLIETRVGPWETYKVIPGLFQIVHARNEGIAFSLFADTGSNKLLIGFSVAVLAMVSWMLWTACRTPASEHWTMRAALGLVLGGAMGNLYDRVVFGSVTDFLDFFIGHSHFPIFNVADSAITVGAALLLINLWWVRRPCEPGSETPRSSESR
ncbi:MAG: signal peptidase II [Bryobacterales bacterium]|nr:signal peptidase II [Bryobacterales bacterium]